MLKVNVSPKTTCHHKGEGGSSVMFNLHVDVLEPGTKKRFSTDKLYPGFRCPFNTTRG